MELEFTRLAALRSGTVGSRIHHLDRVGSTMDAARALAESNAPDGLVVSADEQTMGRGRFARPWISTPGRDLMFSVVLRPRSDQLRLVNMAATMAVQEAAAAVTGQAASIKWPNDVLMSGRKVAGILVESCASRFGGPSHAVVGIGLNVNLSAQAHPEIRDIATSLAEQAGAPIDRTDVLLEVLGRLDGFYSELRDGSDLAGMWSERIETIGHHVQVRWQDRLISGMACGVDGDGNLLIQTEQEIVTVLAGEVTLSELPS